MLSLTTALIIAAVIGIAGTVTSGVLSYNQQNKTNNFNEQQYIDYKLYNSPVRQMSRLRQAGLNPYMVSGVNNTLSQPFSVGSNQGISEMMSSLGQNLSQAVGNLGQSRAEYGLRQDQLELNRQTLANKLEQTRLNTIGMQIKQKLAENAIKIGDARTALIMSDTDLNKMQYRWLDETFDIRKNILGLNQSLLDQKYDFLDKYNPLYLQYYGPVQRSIINQRYRQMSHLDWSEQFDADRFDRQMALNWRRYYQGVNQFDQRLAYDKSRLALSSYYYALAERKFYADVLFRGLDNIIKFKPKVKSKSFAGKPFSSWQW